MNNKTNRLIPELRFPEFKNDGKWEEKKLGNIGNPSMCKRIFKEETTTNSKNGIPFYKIGTFGKEADSFISKEIYEEYKTKFSFPKKGEILISASGTIGRLVVYDGEPAFFQDSNIVWISNDENEVKNNFLYYIYSLVKWQTSDGGIIQRLYNADLKSVDIAFPKNKNEQQKISDCLSSLEELITALINKLEILKKHKKGLMQNLFPQEGERVPKLRFKEFEKDGNWVGKKLIDTVDKKIKWSFTGGPFGSNLKASDYTSNGIRIIQLQNIGDSEFKDNYKIYTSIEKANELLSCNIYSGEIIISKMGDPVGRACIIPEKLVRCVLASDGIRLVVDEKKYSKYFIFSLINSEGIREAIEKKSTGSTRKRIGLDDLKTIDLFIPKDIKEQQKIGVTIYLLDNLIKEQNNKIEQLKSHKKGLMQSLFPKMKN
ncbi:restriction endonuclease subunit S [Flavobacterium sp. C3NV]|uniref:restriction endonuclease subunit S n=1 Tax=Flavobacterium sp. C3NV TaxID=3393358 RepID=UPI00399028F6